MIEAIDLCKTYGDFQAVRSVTLTVEPGEVLALLGPNGAGKTTTVRMLGAIITPTSGRATVAGYDVVRQPRLVRSRIGLLTEYPGLYSRMRAMDYLRFFGSMLGMDASQSTARAEFLLRQFGLWDARDKRLDSYSKGMRQKVALVRALIHDPPVLFLDEPTTAMDPQSARTVRNAIGELRAAERAILLTTHNLTEAEELADRIAIVRGGEIIARGTAAELTRQLLGEPIWEVRVATPHAALEPLLADLIAVEVAAPDRVQYRTAEPHLVNPRVIERLTAQGIPLLSLAEVPRNLEQVYLRIVDSQQHSDPRYQLPSTNGTAPDRQPASTAAMQEVSP